MNYVYLSQVTEKKSKTACTHVHTHIAD